MDKTVDTEHTLGFAVDDDIAPDDIRRLRAVGRSESGFKNHACSFAVHLVVRQQTDIPVAAEAVGVVVVANRLQFAYFERKILLHVFCKFFACGCPLHSAGAEGK